MPTFTFSTWEAEPGDLYEFEAILVYKARSRTARAVTKKNLSQKQTSKQAKKQKQARKIKGEEILFESGICLARV